MKRAFTLIELLVVISVIAILAAMLLPAVAMVRAAARSSICAGKQRQLVAAIIVYAQDNEGTMPSTVPSNDVGGPTSAADYANYFWAHQVGEMLEDPWNYNDPANQSRLFRCPAQSRFSLPGFQTSYVMTWYGSHPDYMHPAPLSYKWITLSRFAKSNGGVLGEARTDGFAEDAAPQPWWILEIKRLDSIKPVNAATGWPAAYERHRGRFNAAFADGHISGITLPNYYSEFFRPVW
jgi:prepilin-type N-terminal cleavage/methylation domain-containing protein/prepilin-type processing-associated H-X9-DG protein